jgi:hypothetical protein
MTYERERERERKKARQDAVDHQNMVTDNIYLSIYY